MRAPPEPLYSQVFDLATAITNASEADDEDAHAQALQALRDLYDARSSSGTADPFLTETLADYESDPMTRAQLYRVALAQSSAFPDEPLHTKQIGLAECLIELGEVEEPRMLLQEALERVAEAEDEWELKQVHALLSRVAV